MWVFVDGPGILLAKCGGGQKKKKLKLNIKKKKKKKKKHGLPVFTCKPGSVLVYFISQLCTALMCVKRSSSVFAPSRRICKWRTCRCVRGIYTLPLPCGSARPVFGQHTDIQCFVAQLCDNSAQIRFTPYQRRYHAQIAWPNSSRRDRILLLLLSEIFCLASFYILSDFKILLED